METKTKKILLALLIPFGIILYVFKKGIEIGKMEVEKNINKQTKKNVRKSGKAVNSLNSRKRNKLRKKYNR